MSPHQVISSPSTGVPYRSAGRNGIGGAEVRHEHDAELVGRVRGELAQEPQDLRRLVERPVDGPAQHDRADRVQVVLERGGDAEVAAAAAQAPEQLRLRAGVDAQPLPVGGDQVDRAQVVDGEPVPAHQVPEPAAQRHSADARRS